VDADLIRIKSYAPRIRRLGWHPAKADSDHPIANTVIDSEILQAFTKSGIIPLPNLRACRWTLDDGSCHDMRLFLGLKLLYLEVDVLNAYVLYALFNTLEMVCPSLRSLHLSTPETRIVTFPWAVDSLHCLEVLSCPDFTLPDAALRTLAASRTLCTLHINNDSEDLLRCISTQEPSFSNLEDLFVRTSRIAGCSQLINQIKPIHLRFLEVSHAENVIPLESDVRLFFQVLQDCCSHTQLISIRLGQDYDEDVDYGLSGDNFAIATVAPLFAFKNLEELELIIEHPFDFGNACVETMTAAWPRMKLFHLGSTSSEQNALDMTLDGLIPMARRWPDLNSLSISFCAVTGDPHVTPHRPGGGACCPNLTTFYVGCSTIYSEAGTIAAFLTDLFPNLTGIIAEDTHEADWESVEELLNAFHMVRKQERAWSAQVCLHSNVLESTTDLVDLLVRVSGVSTGQAIYTCNTQYLHESCIVLKCITIHKL